ncbi:MAG: hypothetical protein RMX96_09110 [Nostoc sp. ChiSLP02]|nr:hypothetical protein [Nostoc sp. DedSLP05]MDZ8101727.1 hypothetical protein [Nostoc sp. DedSLP01]MDZ8184999.1 hypothetical protein [Nostoc sp. ChiSLP02]
MDKNQYSPLFRLTTMLIKSCLLAIFGFTIAYILSMGFGALHIFVALLPFVGNWFPKLAIILLCFIITTVVWESLR